MKASHVLRRALASKEICVAPGVYDLVSAKMAERAGFPILIASFAPLAEWMLQQEWSQSHDLAVRLQRVFLDQVRLICETIPLPVILDTEMLEDALLTRQDGVTQLEQWGLAGVIASNRVEEEQEQMIRALLVARNDSAFAIIAASQHRAPATLPHLVQRVKGFRSAGADMVSIQGLASVEEMETIAAEIVDVPLMIKMRESGNAALLSAYELQNLGYSIAYWQSLALSASTQAAWEALRELKILGKGRRQCSSGTG